MTKSLSSFVWPRPAQNFAPTSYAKALHSDRVAAQKADMLLDALCGLLVCVAPTARTDRAVAKAQAAIANAIA